MTKAPRPRIEWLPGQAALAALELAAGQLKHLKRQDLIDYLVLTGCMAMQVERMRAPGCDRDRWELPALLTAAALRKIDSPAPMGRASNFRNGLPPLISSPTVHGEQES